MKNIMILLVLFLLFIPSLSAAGEYALIKGEGVEVCEAYRDSLNSFNPDNEYIMACERKINPEHTDFKKPEWKEIDLWENREFLKKVELFLGEYYYDPKKNTKDWEKLLKDRIKEDTLYRTTMYITEMDINNDGKKENVIQYKNGYCPGGNYYGAALLVLNDDKSDIDIEKTKPLLQNYRSLKNGPLSEGWDGTMYDIFIYRNKTYFDRWRHSNLSLDGKTIEKTHKLLKVFVIEPDKNNENNASEICQYKFRSTK